MAAELEHWAPRQARRFEDTTLRLRQMLRELATEAEVEARSHIHDRSGKLAASVRGEVRGYALSLTASAPYARIQEEGGTIHGRPWLTVPLRGQRGSARNDGDLFVLTLRDGRKFLASREGGRLDLRWRLMRSVTLPARPFLRPALERVLRRMPVELEYVLKAVHGG